MIDVVAKIPTLAKRGSVTILTGKNYILLNSIQEFIEIETWLLLTFFICLYNQLSLQPHIKEYFK